MPKKMMSIILNANTMLTSEMNSMIAKNTVKTSYVEEFDWNGNQSA